MKLFHSFTFAATFIAASLLPSNLIASNFYNIDFTVNPNTYTEFDMTGTIWTDGTTGAIGKGNLAVVDLKITTFDGTYTVTQASDVTGFNVYAANYNLSLTGSGIQNVSLNTDGGNGVMLELFYDPQTNQDSIYVQDIPSGNYYYYSATALAPISLDRSVNPTVLPTSLNADIPALAPEPGSLKMMVTAGLALIGFTGILQARRKRTVSLG